MTTRASAEELERLTLALRRVEDRAGPTPELPGLLEPTALGAASLAEVLQVSRSAVMVTDADLDAPGPVIRYVNPAFEQLSGYTSAEVIGRDPRFLQGEATDRRVLRRLRSDLEANGSFEGQTFTYRKDGTAFVMSWRISAVRRDDGTTQAYVAVQDDVTQLWLDRIRGADAVTSLQRNLLPARLDAVDGVEVATLYRPADDESRVGGDWFDVVAVDGTVHLVVGDVTGHGVAAAAAMGKLRFALSCLLRSGLAPAAAVDALRDSLDREHQRFATVAIASVDETRRQLSVCTFGHPAVLHTSGGSTATLRSRHPMLGVDPPAAVDVVHTELAPGDLIVLFTDGLIETRTTAVQDGTRALADHLASAHTDRDVSAIASDLVDHALGSRRPSDDLAVLVARVGVAAK